MRIEWTARACSEECGPSCVNHALRTERNVPASGCPIHTPKPLISHRVARFPAQLVVKCLRSARDHSVAYSFRIGGSLE